MDYATDPTELRGTRNNHWPLVWVTFHDFEVIASGDVKVEINGKFIRHSTAIHPANTVGANPQFLGPMWGMSPRNLKSGFGFNQI